MEHTTTTPAKHRSVSDSRHGALAWSTDRDRASRRPQAEDDDPTWPCYCLDRRHRHLRNHDVSDTEHLTEPQRNHGQ